MATGRVGVRLKPPVSAVPRGSGQGARDPGSAPQTGAAGPESRECSAPVCSSGRGAQRLPGGPGHRPTSARRWGAGGEAWRPSLHPLQTSPGSTPSPPAAPRALTRGVQEKWSTLSGSASCSKSKLPVPTLLEDVGQGHQSPVRVKTGNTGASELKGLGSILSRSPKVSGVRLSKREELGKSASQVGGC